MKPTVGTIKNGVLFGLNDYLYLFDGAQNQFDYLTGKKFPTNTSISNFFLNLAGRDDLCSARGIRYMHLVFPSKPIITKDNLPQVHKELVQSLFLRSYAASRVSKQFDYLHYPIDLLNCANAESQVFHPLDTHLNQHGSFLVAHYILNFLGLSYNPEDHLQKSTSLSSGDLAKMANITTQVETPQITLSYPSYHFDNLAITNRNTNNCKIILNPYATTERRLLVFGDSFIKFCLPYLTPCFRDIVYIRSSFIHKDIIDLIKPDAVITSNAERYLASIINDEQAHPIIFDLLQCPTSSLSINFQLALKSQLSFHYYHHVYNEWASPLKSKQFNLPPLGSCSLNDDVHMLGVNSTKFMSTGVDPQLLFHRTPLDNSRSYIICIEMTSSVESMAAIYYQDKTVSCFNERSIVCAKVDAGHNRLVFNIPAKRGSSVIRFDPLCHTGAIDIHSIRVQNFSKN